MKKNVICTGLAVLSASALIMGTPVNSYGASLSCINNSNKYIAFYGRCDNIDLNSLENLLNRFASSGQIPDFNWCPDDTESESTEELTTSSPEEQTSYAETVTTQSPESDGETECTTVSPPASVPEEETTSAEVTAPETETTGSADSEDSSISEYAKKVVNLVNEERKKAGVNTVDIDIKLTNAANVRSKEIVSNFSHTRPDGTSFYTAIKEQGFSYRGCGENIAWGQKSPDEVMNAWMNSDGHRSNILNSKYTKIGVGVYEAPNGRIYWTQLFAY